MYLIKCPDPGLIPGFESLTNNGDILKKRKMLTEVHPTTSSIIKPNTNNA
jgi:hypothetical protein